MGERGPAGKRPEEKRRRNKDGGVKTEGTAAANVKPPAAKRDWHPIAKAWYKALAASGQSEFYEPSDWAMALMVAESISRDLNPQVVAVPEKTGKPVFEKVPMKGASLSAYLKAMTDLMVSEAARRRAGIALKRAGADTDSGEKDGAKVVAMESYRKAAGG
jgi:hypothetical protein